MRFLAAPDAGKPVATTVDAARKLVPPGDGLTPEWDFVFRAGCLSLANGMFAAGQQVRIKSTGLIGRIFFKLPMSNVYLVQWPGFPLIEKLYYASELEAVDLSWARPDFGSPVLRQTN